jgi:hypothetical protein
MMDKQALELWCDKCKKRFWVEKPIPKTTCCPICKETAEIKSERVPYEEIKNLWNSICISFPKVVSVTDKRKASLRCRWEQLKELRVFEEAFKKLESSDFCKGKNDRKWKASFDWIIANQTNIVKVLEGKYDNYNVSYSKNSQGTFDKMRDLSYLVE